MPKKLPFVVLLQNLHFACVAVWSEAHVFKNPSSFSRFQFPTNSICHLVIRRWDLRICELIFGHWFWFQELCWWIPKSVYQQRTWNPRTARGFPCFIQLSCSHIRADLCHLLAASLVCGLLHIGVAFLPHWFLWENGGGRRCCNCFHHGKDCLQHPHFSWWSD